VNEEAATVAEGDAQMTVAPSRGQSTHPTPRLLGLLKIGGLIIIVVLAAALSVTKVQLGNADSLNNQRIAALADARTYASNVATYSYLHMKDDFGRVEDESTPSFRRSFIKSSGALSKVLVRYKADAKAKVLAAGLVSITSKEAVVILFVNQTVANTAQKSGGSTDNSRIKVTLERSGGRWLLQDLKLQ
jgi:Mce-associated membrane protein